MIARSDSPIAHRAMRKKERDRGSEAHSFLLTFDRSSILQDLHYHITVVSDEKQWGESAGAAQDKEDEVGFVMLGLDGEDTDNNDNFQLLVKAAISGKDDNSDDDDNSNNHDDDDVNSGYISDDEDEVENLREDQKCQLS
jgi:hypothetical protein